MTTRGDLSSTEGLMSAWQLRDYGGVESLELVKDLPIPKIISSKRLILTENQLNLFPKKTNKL